MTAPEPYSRDDAVRIIRVRADTLAPAIAKLVRQLARMETSGTLPAELVTPLLDVARELEPNPCPYAHAHTRNWCGHPACRES